MHEEAQRVDQPAQDKMVAAQQIEGHLRPERERIKKSSTVAHLAVKKVLCLSFVCVLKRLTYRNS